MVSYANKPGCICTFVSLATLTLFTTSGTTDLYDYRAQKTKTPAGKSTRRTSQIKTWSAEQDAITVKPRGAAFLSRRMPPHRRFRSHKSPVPNCSSRARVSSTRLCDSWGLVEERGAVGLRRLRLSRHSGMEECPVMARDCEGNRRDNTGDSLNSCDVYPSTLITHPGRGRRAQRCSDSH